MVNPKPAQNSGELKEKATGNHRGFVLQVTSAQTWAGGFVTAEVFLSPRQPLPKEGLIPVPKAPGFGKHLGRVPSFLGSLGDSGLSGNVAANDRNPDGLCPCADAGTAVAEGVAAGGLGAWGCAGCLSGMGGAAGCRGIGVAAASRLGLLPPGTRRVCRVPLVAGKYWVVEGEVWGKGAFLETNVLQGCVDARK